MPSKSLAQHRFIEWVAHDSAAQKKTGLSQTKASEWAHADKGSPWQHHATGGGIGALADGGSVEEDTPDFTNKYNTDLSPGDEAKFQAWGASQAPQNGGRNPAADTYDYDMRGFWKSGASLSSNGHAGDEFKKPNHPTFSTYSKYHGTDGYEGGTWGGGQNGQPWTFTPSPTNMKMYDANDLQRYFQEQEPNNRLILPGGGISVQHRDIGGGVLDPSNGPTGLAPTAQNQNPMQQNALQSYSQETPEKLQETLARLGGPASPQGALVARVLKQKQMAPQPVGQFKRGGAMKRADGGDMGVSPSQGSPWWTRAEARSGAGGGGFLHGTTAGRADKVETSAPGGSYVLPADIIAGLGEGNGLAGARVTQEQLSTGPRGIPLPRSGGGRGMPRPPPALREAKGGTIPIFPERAAGGVSGKSETPVLLSHGEFVLTPDECVRIGRGLHKFFMTPAGEKILRTDRTKGLLAAMDSEADKKRGHRILDAFVVHKRGEQVKKIAKLPPPVKA